jgi:hypothetical protein
MPVRAILFSTRPNGRSEEGATMNRLIRVTIATAMVAAMVGLGAGVSSAATPGVNETFHERRAVYTFELEPEQACPLGIGTVTAVESGVGHLVAAGIDVGDPNDPNDDVPIAPARTDLNLTSRLTFVPSDPSLPTYTGHDTRHFAWSTDEDGIGTARIERTIVMTGSDGSRYFLHQVGRAVFDLSQLSSPNEGLVEITTDKIWCH